MVVEGAMSSVESQLIIFDAADHPAFIRTQEDVGSGDYEIPRHDRVDWPDEMEGCH